MIQGFKGIQEHLMGKKGEVFDMEGKKIPPGSKIMGGKAVDDDYHHQVAEVALMTLQLLYNLQKRL